MWLAVDQGGKTMRVKFADATVKQILAAAKGEQAGSKHSRRSPAEVAFVTPLGKDKELRSVSVRGGDGKVYFGGVPLTALARFLTAVRGVDWRKALPAAK